MSKSRKQWLKDNKDKHNWRYNFESFPEKAMREWLETLDLAQNSNIVAEHTPEDFDRNFKIDFAILDKKIAIEVNGNQHYKRNCEYNDYHLQRQEYIVSKGWKVINVPSINILKDFDSVKRQIIELTNATLQSVENITRMLSSKQVNAEKKKQRKDSKRQKRKQDLDNKIRRRLDLIKDIDLTKFGWVGKVSKVLGITSTNTRRFMDKYYTGQFYRRDSN